MYIIHWYQISTSVWSWKTNKKSQLYISFAAKYIKKEGGGETKIGDKVDERGEGGEAWSMGTEKVCENNLQNDLLSGR